MVAGTWPGQGAATASEPAWNSFYDVTQDPFSDRVTSVITSMEANTGWIRGIDRPIRRPVSVTLDCSLASSREPDGELTPGEPELKLQVRLSTRHMDWAGYLRLIEPRLPDSNDFSRATWLDVRVDSKPPLALDAEAFSPVRTVTYVAGSGDTQLLDYMRGGDVMAVRVRGVPTTHRLSITGSEPAHAEISAACIERQQRVYPH